MKEKKTQNIVTWDRFKKNLKQDFERIYNPGLGTFNGGLFALQPGMVENLTLTSAQTEKEKARKRSCDNSKGLILSNQGLLPTGCMEAKKWPQHHE